jgi:nucleotide-binding universal stress UspA family protein
MTGLILVALDGSPLTEQALSHAGRFAEQAGATLLLVRAARNEEMAEADAYLGAVQERLDRAGYRAGGMVVGGDPARAILTAARWERADLIVVGALGRSGNRGTAPDSVAGTVLRDATLPVLVVPISEHASAAADTSYRRILVPLDGSAAAERALALVAHAGWASAAEVVLLRAIPAPPAPRVPEGLHLSAQQLRERAGWETEHALLAARDYLERAAYRYVQHSIPHFSVPLAYPAKAILDVAAGCGIDLIVMTAHGAGHGQHVHGGVAARVLRHTAVPMLCLPGAGAAAHDSETILGGMARAAKGARHTGCPRARGRCGHGMRGPLALGKRGFRSC